FLRVAHRNLVTFHDPPQRLEDGFGNLFALQCPSGLFSQKIKAMLLAFAKVVLLLVPERLSIHNVVAVTTPGVKEDRILTGSPVKQTCRRSETLRSLRDCSFAAGQNG